MGLCVLFFQVPVSKNIWKNLENKEYENSSAHPFQKYVSENFWRWFINQMIRLVQGKNYKDILMYFQINIDFHSWQTGCFSQAPGEIEKVKLT